jgi:hypothetical protein
VLLGGVLGASLAAGLGLAFLLSQLKPTFFDGRSLREFAGMPLLGTVSIVRDARMRARARWATVAYSASGLTYVLLFGALIAWVALRSPAP